MDKEKLTNFVEKEVMFNKIKEDIKIKIKRRSKCFGYPVEDILILSEEQIQELIQFIAIITNGFFDILIKQVELVTFDKDRIRHSIFKDEVLIKPDYIKKEINEL